VARRNIQETIGLKRLIIGAVKGVISFVGAELAVVSETEQGVYRDIEKTTKKEQLIKRDDW
jgi:hypothetical protein